MHGNRNAKSEAQGEHRETDNVPDAGLTGNDKILENGLGRLQLDRIEIKL